MGASELTVGYLGAIDNQLKRVAASQEEVIEQAAELVARRIAGGGRLAVFGCGHAVIPVLELFCRGGGLVPVLPVFATGMMLWDWPVSRGFEMERKLPEYGPLLLEHAGLEAGDVLLVVSTAGTIPIAVETTLAASRMGVPTVALSSVEWSRGLEPVHASGKRVFEVADLVVDNCGGENYGTAVEVAPDVRAGPTASLADLFIVNLLSLQVIDRLATAGQAAGRGEATSSTDEAPEASAARQLPVLKSNHVPGGLEHNDALFEAYRDKLRWI
jgi:uncharacterized phosphosugar-binding protein